MVGAIWAAMKRTSLRCGSGRAITFGISCTWCRCTASCAWSTTSAASASSKPVEGEVYFHRNSVIEVEFDAIEPGSKVRLEVTERESDDGWQATTVRLIGKYHVQDLTA
jgi:cold shock CspA family protein